MTEREWEERFRRAYCADAASWQPDRSVREKLLRRLERRTPRRSFPLKQVVAACCCLAIVAAAAFGLRLLPPAEEQTSGVAGAANGVILPDQALDGEPQAAAYSAETAMDGAAPAARMETQGNGAAQSLTLEESLAVPALGSLVPAQAAEDCPLETAALVQSETGNSLTLRFAGDTRALEVTIAAALPDGWQGSVFAPEDLSAEALETAVATGSTLSFAVQTDEAAAVFTFEGFSPADALAAVLTASAFSDGTP